MTRRRGIRLVTIVGSLAVVAGAGPGWAGSSTVTGSMHQGRMNPTATRLPSGKVLVAGGLGGGNTAELFDPATGAWQATGSMAVARYGHVAALLPNGSVLVAGGQNTDGAPTTVATSTEIYSPAAGTWSAGPAMNSPHDYPAVATLAGGKVLVAGGSSTNFRNDTLDADNETGAAPNGSAEIYDPATSTWTTTGPMVINDNQMRALVLPDGRVFTGCGALPGDFEVYDPSATSALGVAGQWRLASPAPVALALCAASLLPDGRVLVTGGERFDQEGQNQIGFDPSGNINRIGGGSLWPISAASITLIYDPATDTWTSAPSLPGPRADATARTLPDGRVLIVGGSDNAGTPLTSTEIYNPSTGTWAAAATTPRLYLGRACCAVATLLANGTVLFAGGEIVVASNALPVQPTNEAELIQP